MSNSSKTIHSAIISVFYKDKLEPILQKLNQLGVTIYSTGGTLKFIQEKGYPVLSVEAYTGFPEILNGRVKTLHPSIFGGILARRDNPADMQELSEHQIQTIDLVIVDLYPFEETLKNTGDESEIIEKIDIGGVSLIRACAKNFKDTLIVSHKNEYEEFLELLHTKNGSTDIEDRHLFACRAFMNTSHYDTAIFHYFNIKNQIPVYKKSLHESKQLRYGENPHQKGRFYGNLDEILEVLNGREMSYNNLVDTEASLQLLSEFDEPTFVIMKHTNSCGLASRNTLVEAYAAAFACDSVSAFGGVLACNREIDIETAEKMNSLFFEVISAPSYSEEALEILRQKKNRIILRIKKPLNMKIITKSLFNGILEQESDWSIEPGTSFKVISKLQPTRDQIADLEFAIKAVKHLKSNGISIVRNKQLIGMGCGQTSRIDALESALKKARDFGFETKGAVMASEAFFPFPDCVDISHKAGISAIAQPGGSIKDQESVDAADKNGQSMVITGIRHFKH